MRHYHAGTDEAPTYAQVDVSSGTTPYTLGFRKAFKITNGNQTGGADAGDAIELVYRPERQDIAKSGWNYTSSSSFVTLSFWIKSSVAQNFYGHITSSEGTQMNYPFETGSLTADTWTKVVRTIPGNSNLQFSDDDTDKAFDMKWVAFRGTTYTGSGATLNQWSTYASGSRMPDNTSTWYTTNDATLEITGIQFEVGSQATPFEHRTYAEEIRLCYRYYYKLKAGASGFWGSGVWYSSTAFICFIAFPVVMRVAVSALEQSGTASHYKVIGNATTYTCSGVPTYGGDTNNAAQSVNFNFSSGPSQGQSGISRSGSSSSYLAWDAEI